MTTLILRASRPVVAAGRRFEVGDEYLRAILPSDDVATHLRYAFKWEAFEWVEAPDAPDAPDLKESLEAAVARIGELEGFISSDRATIDALKVQLAAVPVATVESLPSPTLADLLAVADPATLSAVDGVSAKSAAALIAWAKAQVPMPLPVAG